MKSLAVVALVLAAAAVLLAAPRSADGAGECGQTSPDRTALKLAPCLSATKDPGATPSGSCCKAVKEIGGKSPACLCAVLLSNTAKRFGVKTGVAVTIPKRCNIANRPIGYKCGGYTIPSVELTALQLAILATEAGSYTCLRYGLRISKASK